MNERNTGTGVGPWVVISDYPAWPSPYFAEFARHAPHALRLEFTSHLDELTTRSGPPGVINLHRLKRLYTHNGTRTVAATQAMLIQLSRLRAAGWKLVWTVHNLLPVDAAHDTTDPLSGRGSDGNSTPDSDSGSGPGWHAVRKADLFAAHGVLAIADAVVTHTRADADHLATVTDAPIIVAGWAAPTPTPDAASGLVPGSVTALARRMSMAPFSVLVLGNVAVRKDLPTVVDTFARATRHAELFVVGHSRDHQLTALLRRQAAGEQRVHLHLDRVPPGQIHVLYQAADVALCPYGVDSQWSFLGQAFFPGSVATAVAYGTPVIAPDLPAIHEITENLPRRLYPPAEGPALALTAAESEAREHQPVPAIPPAVHGEHPHSGRWRAIGATYVRLARALHTGEPIQPAVCPVVTASKEPMMPNPSTPSDPAPTSSGATQAHADTDSDRDAIVAVLADRYDLTVQTMGQLLIGQGTVNYQATCDGRDVFVKRYPPGTDLVAEQRAIYLSDLARRHDVPTAPVLANRDDQLIDTSTPHAMSVWQWMPGHVVTVPNTEQNVEVGDALGRIHAVFARLPESTGPAQQADNWFRRDPASRATMIDQLLDIIAERTKAGIADTFDTRAEQTLTERLAMLARIPELLAQLPLGLTTQVLHGDYSPVNLLFTDTTLTAVVDFRPPDPFLVSYDLGRIAFFPHTVTSTPDWLRSAHTLITAYLNANPAIPDEDILACGRVALLQLLGSLYGVKQHYLKPSQFQGDLDEFWLQRHQTVATLLHHLADTDQLLADLVATRHH